MKHLFWMVPLIFSLTACGGASAPGGGRCREGICVKIDIIEPIRFEEPVTLIITVVSEKDYSDFFVSLSHDVDVVVEGPQDWEKDLQDVTIYKSGASWKTAIQANEQLTYKRMVHLPPREGWLTIVVSVGTLQGLRVEDSISIHLTREGGKVNHSGTRIPITPGPELVDTMDPSLLATLRARPTETPYPTLTAVPTTEAPPLEVLGTPAYPPPETPYP